MSKSESQVVALKTTLILGAVLLLALFWFVWVTVINSKQNIFESMLENSLLTTGVTKKTVQENPNGSLEQLAQAQFGSRNVVEVKTTITQGTEDNETKVITKTIATPHENYARYEEISVPSSTENQADFSEVLNEWGVQLSEEGGSGVFSEAVFGIVLFGNLTLDQQTEMINFINDKLVYVPNYDNVESKDVNGKSAYAYDVSINTKSYAELIKKYDEMLGLNLFESLNPDDYENTPAISVKLYVDKTSRQLLKVEYEDGRAEEFAGYGIQKEVDIPENPISRTELEAKLQEVLQ
ncbi:hypothetical protein KC950_02905 [Candidatus Saccharibacteria bacterium]|nr:hypothetical protein [Candidatus Saccharibacteria bacterium]